MELEFFVKQLKHAAPRVHCLTNLVTMQDMANLLLAIGGSAIMAQDAAEVEEITAISHATLLNTGTPDAARFQACTLAGKKANALSHPVVLDPVGAGASTFRREQLHALLRTVKPTLIRCNLEEAVTLLKLSASDSAVFHSNRPISPALIDIVSRHTGECSTSGGVESGVTASVKARLATARQLAEAYHCTVLLSGREDIITDATGSFLVSGGDGRIACITGSGCLLSALCAAFLGSNISPLNAALAASVSWKSAACIAGRTTSTTVLKGLGSFHCLLFDAISQLKGNEWKEDICIEHLTRTT